MPFSVDGIGTTYFGRDNLSGRYGVCEHCGKSSYLSSYDTTSYFSVIYLPLIPLGKKRIINQCSVCSKHLVMSLKKWYQAKEETFSETLEACRNNPGESDAAKEALGVRLALGDKEEFLKLAKEVVKNFSDDGEVLSIVGSGCYDYGKFDQAEKIFQRCLSIKDDEDTRQMLGSTLVKLLRAGEAEKYFNHIVTKQQKEKAGLLLFLAMGFQAVGDHQKSLDVLDKAISLQPDLGKDKEYKKTRKTAEKNIYSNTAVVSDGISAAPVKVIEAKSFSAIVAPYLGPAVLITVLLIYLSVCFVKGLGSEVYFVNGLSKPYEITAGGDSYTLIPRRALKVKVGDGKLEVAMAGEWPEIAKQEYKIKTNFFTRPFSDKTFIINPDETALLGWYKTYYAEKSRNAPEGEMEILTCKDFHVLENVDYEFREFPGSLELSTDKTHSRTRVMFLEEVGLSVTLNTIAESNGMDVAVKYLKKKLSNESNNIECLYALSGMVELDEFIETIRPGLGVRPIRIDWHRVYQDTMERLKPDHDLVAEYSKLLQNESEKNVLNYLLGRVVIDYDQAEKYFLKSTEGQYPCPYGYGAIGYNRLCCGKFDEAVEFYEKANKLDRNNFSLKTSYFTSLKAAGKYDQALEVCRNLLRQKPYDYTWVQNEWELLIEMGEYAKAQSRADQWIKNADKAYSIEWLDSVKKNLPVLFAYKKGDKKDYINKLSSILEHPEKDFFIALNSGKVISDEMLPKSELNALTNLLLYIAETKYGTKQKAREFMDKAIKQLGESKDREEKRFADYFSRKINPVPKIVCNCQILPETKRILIAAMGVKFPLHRQVYFELARKLNFTREYPYMFLRTILEE